MSPRAATALALLLALCGCTQVYDVLEPTDGGGVDAGNVDAGAVSGAFALAAGDAHTCAIRGGALWCWGDNADGQVGVGADGGLVTSPARVGADLDWVQVTAGESHTCARKLDGSVWCWGGNGAGQLGQGDVTNRSRPTHVVLTQPAVTVQGRGSFTCALLADERLWCWGANFEGQLALSDGFPGVDRLSPLPAAVDGGFVALATGQGHACAIATDGTLWCWGRNTSSQVGLPADAGVQFRAPQRVGARTDWRSLDVNQEYSCAQPADGTLWCWGDLLANSVVPVPTQLVSGSWAFFRTDLFHLCVVTAAGSASCWGRNLEGELGLGDVADRAMPTLEAGGPFSDLALGRFHSCARRAGGAIVCTGANEQGQLGIGSTARADSWQPVAFP